jgi:hypothetical protein
MRFAESYFRSCCGSALFQQQPMHYAEAPVLVSEYASICNWLYNDSASRT